MRYILSLILLMSIMGCVEPRFYENDEQRIFLRGVSHNSSIHIKGKSDYLVDENNQFYETYCNNHSTHTKSQYCEHLANNTSILLERSFFDKELVIETKGFYDYYLKLDSVMTSDEWATCSTGSEGPCSAFYLLVQSAVPEATTVGILGLPAGLMGASGALIQGDYELASEIATKGISAPFIGTAIDLGQITLVPLPAIVNPWNQFIYSDNPIILTPTDELKQTCQKQKNMFISNSGCIPCDDTIKYPYSSQTECLKCSNRKWNNGACILKSKK
ncbi:MAG: hypothetical protein IJY58_02040 [Alphaproteobacteria bacterium]|nr:hypothetical protein [Alphaproteobacteria bacterium]